jgi:hypothetical protein
MKIENDSLLGLQTSNQSPPADGLPYLIGKEQEAIISFHSLF